MLGWVEPWAVNPLLAAQAVFLGTNGSEQGCAEPGEKLFLLCQLSQAP